MTMLDEVIDVLYDCIKEAGTTGLPSGHLYAVCMGKMSLSTYEGLIRVMKDRKMVRESGHVLYAVV